MEDHVDRMAEKETTKKDNKLSANRKKKKIG